MGGDTPRSEDATASPVETPSSTKPQRRRAERSKPKKKRARSGRGAVARPDTETLNHPDRVRPEDSAGRDEGAAAGASSASTSEATLAATEADRPARVTVLPAAPDGAPAHRYAHVKVIGEGATGDVMLAEDRDIDRPVAIKRLRPELSSRAALARFAQEVRTVGRLEHPNIAPVHDVGIDEAGRYYFVMKYIQGETLEQVIDRLGSGDPEAHRLYTFEYRTQVFIKILEAIEFAHANGVLHRDIKPSNIMIGPYGEVMVMDWGVARSREPRGETSAENVDDPARQGSPSAGRASDARSPAQRARETTADMLVGTPAYMSPEQALADNDKVDERSDVYALCALFYEFLALRYYLTGAVGPDSALTEILMAVVLETPPRPDTLVSEHQSAVPRELSFFVMRGLEKDRDRRFASVRAMIDELKADLDGQICVYCTSTALKRGVLEYAHLLDRHRKFGVVLAVTVTLLAIAGVVALMRLLL